MTSSDCQHPAFGPIDGNTNKLMIKNRLLHSAMRRESGSRRHFSAAELLRGVFRLNI